MGKQYVPKPGTVADHTEDINPNYKHDNWIVMDGYIVKVISPPEPISYSRNLDTTKK